MELYLIRHGIAQERSPDIEDEARELTAAGWEKTRKVAKRLSSLGLRFDLILTSPRVRSRQTAEVLHSCGLCSQIEALSCLAPDGNIQNWLDWLEQRQISTNTQLALVGHQPDLGQWVEILVWGEARTGADATNIAACDPGSNLPIIALKKAGIIGLKLPETGSPVGRAQIFWLTSPRFLL